MYIVGTSGHIDHGKTTLIKALTGIDCDRLPEEKAREMTIDIGFAKIDYPRFGTVSIIDVPGHEKFIRNMVVGAWGIDLGLLVIAIDDGWMPQTEDHFRVLEILGVERIVVVLNKIDLADEETIELATIEVEEKLKETRFAGSDVIRVSSKTGEGIDELKETIVKNLRKLSSITETKKPYLFVDRVFSSKGYGTIITGTLKNGRFHEDENVFLLPQKRESRIKKIESHYHAMTEGTPSQRTALNLSGISTDEIKRGDIIVRDSFFTESSDILVRIKILDRKREIKNNMGIEVLIGTSQLKGKVILIHEEKRDNSAFPARIRFEKSWFFYPTEPFVITLPGGNRVLGGGTVILPQYGRVRKRELKAHLDHLRNYSPDEILRFAVVVNQRIAITDMIKQFPQDEKNIIKILDRLVEEKSVVRIGNTLLDSSFYNSAKKGIVDVISSTIGLNIKEIADHCRIDIDVCKMLMPEVLRENKIVEKDNRYFAGDSITLDTLPKDRQVVLSQILNKKTEGMELNRVDDDLKKRISELMKLGFIISLDGNIIYHIDTYEELKSLILGLFEDKDKISIADAKEITQLSRKYIIPLLNKIEGEGLIKRVGDFRIKA